MPDELLTSISKLLISPIDLTTFRSICDSWRAATPGLRFPPLLMFPFDSHQMTLEFYNLCDKTRITLHLPEAHNKVICGSSHGYLSLMDETGAVSLLNPFTKFLIELPPVDERIASTLFKEVTKQNGLWMIRSALDLVLTPLTKSKLTEVFFKDIILLSPSKFDGDDFVAIGMLGCSDEIAFCKKGDQTWTILDTKLSCNIISIACYRDKIYVIDFVGEMSMCHISSNATATLLPNMTAPPNTRRWNLVASKEELFLVAHTVNFNIDGNAVVLDYPTVVYQADFTTEEPSWCKVESIGSELTLFVSRCSGSNFLGKNISGCDGDSVYFSDVLYYTGEEEKEIHSIEVVHLLDGSIEDIETCHGQFQHSDVVSWFRPNLLRMKE
ncbi:hypothetical protein LUZ61_020378 [Rhynchospora tenuis]|uniref:KIB1-4 beta-propeller domain-containing protein n=1 Tax=Rhynchospora tenuis TaxID=198213 RepID=A0AAD5ZDB4_9POAL|nr:hypothetical protein LUZ61_020378 [Rhynchospora tenuis]